MVDPIRGYFVSDNLESCPVHHMPYHIDNEIVETNFKDIFPDKTFILDHKSQLISATFHGRPITGLIQKIEKNSNEPYTGVCVEKQVGPKVYSVKSTFNEFYQWNYSPDSLINATDMSVWLQLSSLVSDD